MEYTPLPVPEKSSLRPIEIIGIIFMVFIMAIVCYSMSCKVSEKAKQAIGHEIKHSSHDKLLEKTKFIPVDATNITNVGNNWYTFEFDGSKFLYFSDFSNELSSRRNQCITKIKDIQ